MTNPFHSLPLTLLGVAIAGGIFSGCAPASRPAAPPPAAKADDHEHGHDDHADHAHPKTLADGVAELAKAMATVKEKIATEPGAADTAVHDIGHLLTDLRGLLPKAGLSAAAEAAAGKALDDIESHFGKLDEALHAAAGEGDSPADVHASIAEKVEAALAALREVK